MTKPFLSDAAYTAGGLDKMIKRVSAANAAAAPVKINISQTVINDLGVRCPDEDGCWRGIDHAGAHTVSRQQALEIAGDCDFQGNITGNWIDPVSGGLTRAYRALYAQIKAAT